MRVSLTWLKELMDIELGVDELVERLDMTGTAVEAVHTVGSGLDGVIVGRILAKERHPNADTLWVTEVDIGQGEPLHIVCGAQNFEAGDVVPVATVGTTLPNGMTIKKAKLRGEVSEGMNCSPDELGLGGDHSGLLLLPADAPVGTPYAEYAGLKDTVLELEITPNRADCLSVAGLAREIGAITGAEATVPHSAPGESGQPAAESVRVTIEDPELCPRYTARLIRGVTIGESPDWLKAKLIAAGQRPVNNIVDITNYIMFELGQPLHAFDAPTLAVDERGKTHVIVRGAQEGETMTTLDGQERRLSSDMLLITDSSGPIALAGVMGGESTEVSDRTTDILLESACFDAATTSLTSRSLGLISEASLRFERGVDPNGCAAAADRAAALMAEICGGEVAPGIVDAYPQTVEPMHVPLRITHMNEILGTQIPAEDARVILGRLGMSVASGEGSNELDVVVPTFRPDVEREIDLVEEVVRVWGMDRVDATLPGGRERIGRLTREQRWRERIGATLRAAGLNETMTYSFCDEQDLERLGWEWSAGRSVVRLLNPMSEEQSVMRRTLVPGLLRSVSYNQRRDVDNVHLYEMGTIFWAEEGRQQPMERAVIAGVLAGRWHEPQWHDRPEPKDGDRDPHAGLRSYQLNFFDGKGVVESLMEDLGIAKWKAKAQAYPWLQPGRSAQVVVAGQDAGWVGEVHPRVLDSFDAQGPVVVFELATDVLLSAALEVKTLSDIPRFPAVELDIALVVDEDVSAERVSQAILSAGGKLLESARLFDVYRGPGVPEGKKSLAYELTYRAADRTLTDDEVRPAHDKLVRKVSSAVGAELRS